MHLISLEIVPTNSEVLITFYRTRLTGFSSRRLISIKN